MDITDARVIEIQKENEASVMAAQDNCSQPNVTTHFAVTPISSTIIQPATIVMVHKPVLLVLLKFLKMQQLPQTESFYEQTKKVSQISSNVSLKGMVGKVETSYPSSKESVFPLTSTQNKSTDSDDPYKWGTEKISS